MTYIIIFFVNLITGFLLCHLFDIINEALIMARAETKEPFTHHKIAVIKSIPWALSCGIFVTVNAALFQWLLS